VRENLLNRSATFNLCGWCVFHTSVYTSFCPRSYARAEGSHYHDPKGDRVSSGASKRCWFRQHVANAQDPLHRLADKLSAPLEGFFKFGESQEPVPAVNHMDYMLREVDPYETPLRGRIVAPYGNPILNQGSADPFEISHGSLALYAM